MTIKELYEFAKEHEMEDCKIILRNRDGFEFEYDDEITPPFTDGQKKLIEMTEKLTEKRGGKMTELKPCPFCGGKAILYIDCGYYIAECEDCEAMSGEHETEEETIKAWNKRVR